MIEPHPCGADRERALVPNACGPDCMWPECLSEHARTNLRAMAEGQAKRLIEEAA